MAAALGYVERNRNMAKELGEVPGLPPGSVVRRMSRAEFPAWQEKDRAFYIQSWVDRGVPVPVAERRSEAAYRAQLPDGADTADVALRVLSHDGTDVGTLWVALRPPHMSGGFVFAVEVAAEHRGGGHGRTLMLQAERECLAAGRTTLGLNVFAGNTPAQRLYESLGYRPTEHHLYKPLL